MDKSILKRWGIFILAYTVCFILLFKTLRLTAPFLIALLVTNILYKPSLKLKNKFKLSSSITTIISVISFYITILILLLGLSAGLGFQVKEILSYVDTDLFLGFFDTISQKVLFIYNGLDPNITNIMIDNLDSINSTLSAFAINSLEGLLNISLSIAKNIPYILTVIGFSVISTFFMLKESLNGSYKDNFITKSKYWQLILKCKNMIFKYCGSFVMIVGFSFLQVLILLLICKVPNALLISILSAILDVLPIVGMAIILVPLGLYYIYVGAYVKGIIILVGYLLICIIRQLTEPKIMATTLNISPLSSVMAIFIGLTAYGFIGMLFCMFFVVFATVLKDELNKI